MYRLIYQKTAHFLSVHMSLVRTFFQMFIVFGMYNFVYIEDGVALTSMHTDSFNFILLQFVLGVFEHFWSDFWEK